MTKAVSNREICFIEAVLLMCEHGHLFLNFASHGVKSPPPNTIRVKECFIVVNAYNLSHRTN